jgi:hypothetical protein
MRTYAENAAYNLQAITDQVERFPQWKPYADMLYEWIMKDLARLRGRGA